VGLDIIGESTERATDLDDSLGDRSSSLSEEELDCVLEISAGLEVVAL
jgi:hypothetical protein